LLFSKQAIGAVMATLVLGLVQWVIFGGLWVWYLQRSQRVRVTFEHTLKTYCPTNTVPTSVPELETSIHADAEQTTSEIASTTVTEMATHASDPAQPAVSNADVHSGAIDVKAITPQPSASEDEEVLWSQALAELDGSDRKQGLWAQCYATHHGQEPAARANYLKARVAQLRTERETAAAR
jgi:cytoskeletal protein RodZ